MPIWLCWDLLMKINILRLHDAFRNVLVARVHVDVLVRVVLYLILSGRNCKMSADENQYAELFGLILTEMPSMARCACVACNSCTCACACRNTPSIDDIEWIA